MEYVKHASFAELTRVYIWKKKIPMTDKGINYESIVGFTNILLRSLCPLDHLHIQFSDINLLQSFYTTFLSAVGRGLPL